MIQDPVGLLDETSVVDYLAGRGLIDPETATARSLGGGVSNVVLAVEDGTRRLVLKQALPRLRVADEWLAPVDRVITEAVALELAADLTPDSVPPVLDRDAARHTLVLAQAPAEWADWKRRLLAGEVDNATADRLGTLLARWHSLTRDQTGRALPDRLADTKPFELLRVDPYHRTVARRAPEVAPAVLALVEEMADHRDCLVHGDFSPKNVLVGPRSGCWVIDFEVAHIGDPAFDLGFLLTHLTLKAVHRPAYASLYDGSVTAFVTAYDTHVAPPLRPRWDYVLRHVACLLLARVRGKSPAEYLTPADQGRAWRLGVDLLHDPPDEPDGLIQRRQASAGS